LNIAFPLVSLAAVRKQRDILYIFAIFIFSRVFLEVIGVLALRLGAPHITDVWTNLITDRMVGLPDWLAIWGRFDSGWFLDLANGGYDRIARASGQANWAFFPLYPMLAAAFADVTGLSVFVSMLLLSNLCFLAALVLILRETSDEFGREAALCTVGLLCFMPDSFVFSAAYTEALFLLLVTVSLIALRRRRWFWAAGAISLATLTRNTGIGLVVPMLMVFGTDMWATRQQGGGVTPWLRHHRAEVLRFLCAVSLPVLVLMGFCLFLYVRTGNPLAFVAIQAAWHREFHFPLFTVLTILHNPQLFPSYEIMNWGFASASFVLLGFLWYWQRWSLFGLGLFMVLVPLSAGLESYRRFFIVMLPLTMASGALLARSPRFAPIVMCGLAMLNGAMMMGWVLSIPFAW